jgi:copper(I)-binding protein
MDASGVMSMQQQSAITIPANGKVEFGPGGLHVMLLNLRKDLRPGEKFQVNLNFQNKGNVKVEAEVREP